MQKKLTISIDERIYNALHEVIGTGKISRFIETLVSPHVLEDHLANGYREMAEDEVREQEAEDWIESTIVDVDLD